MQRSWKEKKTGPTTEELSARALYVRRRRRRRRRASAARLPAWLSCLLTARGGIRRRKENPIEYDHTLHHRRHTPPVTLGAQFGVLSKNYEKPLKKKTMHPT